MTVHKPPRAKAARATDTLIAKCVVRIAHPDYFFTSSVPAKTEPSQPPEKAGQQHKAGYRNSKYA